MSNYEFWDELGKIFNAVVAYQEKSIEFNKRFINPWIRLGNVFDKQDRHREAVNAYQNAVEIDPGNAQNWCDLGNAYFRMEAYDQAVHAFKRAIELNPESGWPYSNMALIHVTQGDHEQAVLLYKKSIELLQDNKDKAVSWNRLGNLYRKLNEYDLAVQAFQRADELDHENAGFRDELDDVAGEIPPSGANAAEGSDQPVDQLAGPIQLIVEESRIEDAALVAGTVEPVISPEADEDLSGEAGEELPDAGQDSLSEVAVEDETPVTGAPEAEQADPVQSQEQMGRLPQELVLEEAVEAAAAVSDDEIQQAETRVSEEGTAAAEEIVAEPAPEAVETPSNETPEPAVSIEAESPVTVQDVVETFTESLIVTDTATETSDLSLEMEEAKLETPPVVQEPALVAADPTPEAGAAEMAPTVTAEIPETAKESEETGEAIAGAAAAPVAEREATPELLATEEAELELIPEPLATEEAEPESAPELLVIEEAAPETVSEAVETVETAQEESTETTGTLESAPEMPAAVAAVAETPEPAQEPPALQEEIAPEPTAMEADQPVEAPASEETATVEASNEEAVTTEPAAEATQPEIAAEDANNEAEGLQHAAYEEFLKEDGKVLNGVAELQAEEATLVPASTVSAEPATKIDASGEFQIAMDTKNAHVWNELGNVYFNNGSIDDSIVAYSKAIELDRWFAWPYSNLALAYVQKDRFPEAVLLYQRSIELFQNEKDKAVSWNRLGNVYRRMNDYEGAIAAYQRADELDPDNTTLSLQSRFSLLGSYQMEQNASYVA